MMKVFLKSRNLFIITLVAVFQLVNTSCSRKMQPGNTSPKNESQSGELNEKSHSGKQLIEKVPDDLNLIQPSKRVEKGKTVAENKAKTNAQDIIGTAEKYLGVPHCMGGMTRKCMDCSGFVVTVFAEHDIQLPHNAQEQSAYGSTIDRMDELKEGDLVFFTRTYNTKKYITHSGIYIGNNNFIHTSSNTGVSVTSLNQRYWKEKFVFGKRILE